MPTLNRSRVSAEIEVSGGGYVVTVTVETDGIVIAERVTAHATLPDAQIDEANTLVQWAYNAMTAAKQGLAL